jgi:hypothetical protein
MTGFGQRQTLTNCCVGATWGAVAMTKSLPGSQRPSVSSASPQWWKPSPKS